MNNFKFKLIDYTVMIVVAFVFTLFVMALFSCSSEGDELEVANGFPQPLTFEATVDDVTVDDATVTRASTSAKDKWGVGDLVAVTVGGGSPLQYKIATAAQSSTMSGNGTSNTFWWTADGQTKEVRAWFYGDGTYRNACTGAWTLPATQTEANIQGYDFLYASNTLTYSTGSTYALDFYHQLAKVTVNIKYANDASSANNALTAITLTASIYPTGTFAMPAVSKASAVTKYGTWTASGTTSSVTPGKLASANSGYTYTYSALLIPQTFAGNSKLVLTMTFNTLGELTYDTGLTKPEAGKHYIYNITVNKENIKVLQSTFGDWSTGGTDTTVYYKN